MKVFRLYDLKKQRVTVIPYPKNHRSVACRQLRAAENERMRKKKRNRIILRWMRRKLKETALSLLEIAISLSAGYFFLAIVSEKLREIRGYDAIGGEFFAAGIIVLAVFLIIEWARERLWTRR